MIITSGKYKGRKIKTAKSPWLRPTSSKIRESIFNIVHLTEEGTIFYEGDTFFLDLFAGSGIMGLEALSRGAKKVVFAEKNPEIIKVLRQNLEIIKTPESVSLITGDALKILDKFSENEFNFIFIDPPYKSDLYKPVLKKILKNKILKKNGIIVLEHDESLNISEINPGFEVYKGKIYGDSRITVLTS